MPKRGKKSKKQSGGKHAGVVSDGAAALPTREKNQFQNLIKMYDNKLYKKGTL